MPVHIYIYVISCAPKGGRHSTILVYPPRHQAGEHHVSRPDRPSEGGGTLDVLC